MNWLKRKFFRSKQYSLPEGIRIYAFGDIHGCSDLLKHKLSLVEKDLLNHKDKRNIIIFLGDYIDRGHDSFEVIEILCNGLPKNTENIFLKGNHEMAMMGFMDDPILHESWLDFGGIQTLGSYDVDIIQWPYGEDKLWLMAKSLKNKMPDKHKEFLNNLKLTFEIGDYFFVHAGIDPDTNLDEQLPRDLLMIRDKFLNSKKPFKKKIIHGHSPVDKIQCLKNRVNLDTGAFATGNLTCAIFEDNRMNVL